jgi:hypothetical protein
MAIRAWLMHIWVFGASALMAPEAAGGYCAQLNYEPLRPSVYAG